MELLENQFEYTFLTDDIKKTMLIDYIKDLEANHYSLALVEPSRLKEQEKYQTWKSQIGQIEQQILKVKSKYIDAYGELTEVVVKEKVTETVTEVIKDMHGNVIEDKS